jgi:hypothetical protein
MINHELTLIFPTQIWHYWIFTSLVLCLHLLYLEILISNGINIIMFFDNCVSHFLLLWQNTWENNLREEEFILAYSFRGFNSWLLGSVPSGPMMFWWGRTSQWGCLCWSKVAHLLVDRRKRDGQKGARDKIYPSPTQLPSVPFRSEIISG